MLREVIEYLEYKITRDMESRREHDLYCDLKFYNKAALKNKRNYKTYRKVRNEINAINEGEDIF